MIATRPAPEDSDLRRAVRGIPATSYGSPRRHDGIVTRDALAGALRSTHDAIVVVAAPPGAGKTTTIALWEAADDRPFVWVHLDHLDADPVHLLRHLALALDADSPVPPELVAPLTRAGRSPDLDMIPALFDVLADRGEIVVVFDDVHELAGTASAASLDRLVRAVPDSVQIVLAGRTVPPDVVARQRMRSPVVEIDSGVLAMTEAEAGRMFAAAGLHLDDDTVSDLVRRTEGWAGGLHLAALALTRAEPDGGRRTLFSGRDRLVADYLVAEALARTSPDDVTFMERAAVLERMSGELLDEILGTQDAGRRLRDLEAAGNLFVIPLDNDRIWYRFHHLFRDLLRDRLRAGASGEMQDLQQRASHALERRGDLDAALRLAVASGDRERAYSLALRGAAPLVLAGGAARLGQWIDLLGPDAIGESPAAAAAAAWYAIGVGDPALIRRALAATGRFDPDQPLPDGSPSLAVAVAVLRVMTALDGVPSVVADCDLVLGAGDAATNPWWDLATIVQATAFAMLGEHEIARERFRACLTSTPVTEAAALAWLALLDLDNGDTPEAERQASAALRIADTHDLGDTVPAIAVFAIAALVAARDRRPDDAVRAAGQARDLLARLGDLAPRTALLGYALLAEAALALGHRAEARALASEAQRARRRDATATALTERLDALLRTLDAGSDAHEVETEALTSAELRVLTYLPTHYSLREIAEQLIVSRNTAKSHTVAIYRKLGVSSRSEAVARARALGLLA